MLTHPPGGADEMTGNLFVTAAKRSARADHPSAKKSEH